MFSVARDKYREHCGTSGVGLHRDLIVYFIKVLVTSVTILLQGY